MTQHLTSSPVSKVIYSTITSKGQITIPIEIRRYLGVTTHDKIAFVIQPEGIVQVKTPKYRTIASLQGAAGTLKKPLSWKEVERTAHEDHIEEILTRLQIKCSCRTSKG